ncbi:hypothetical protein ACHAQA_000182 [Verticillium albo-atrum]
MAESISEGTLASLLKQVGEQVDADEELASIETDKIDVAVNAPEGGVLREIFVAEGDVVTVGQDIARIETGVQGATRGEERENREAVGTSASDSKGEAPNTTDYGEHQASNHTPSPSSTPVTETKPESKFTVTARPPPQQNTRPELSSQHSAHGKFSRAEREEKMSRMRKTIATRLKQSQNECASLTTLQEIDMTNIIAWRTQYREEVADQHGVRLGYMGAFAKATTLAAQAVPEMNAAIDMARETIVFRDYVDISIAVSAPKGLITPVLRNTESMSIVELEREVAALAKKAREGKLTMPDLEGGNFSISNPGIFGSMFGTPLINYPQAAVFNMNSIKDRVVAVEGRVEIRAVSLIFSESSSKTDRLLW